MPIPGPAADVSGLASVVPAGSPFWLGLNGEWVHVEGVVPTATKTVERPRSELVSIDGHRYSQQAPQARRQWDVQLPYATPYAIAALRVVADLLEDDSGAVPDAWWYDDATVNMLAPRDCYGTELPALVCGGTPLARFAGGEIITTRVRGGVPVTITVWSEREPGAACTFTYPGGAGSVLDQAHPVPGHTTVTPDSDGDLVITIPAAAGDLTSGLMVTEGSEGPEVFCAGEAMPCKVTVIDPGEVLTMHHGGAWRHEYAVAIREVG